MYPSHPFRPTKFAGLAAIALLLLPVFFACDEEAQHATSPSTTETRLGASAVAGMVAGAPAGSDSLGATTTTLPFSGSVSSPSTAWEIIQTGTGGSGAFTASGNNIALQALQNAGGIGLFASSQGSGPAVQSFNSGGGSAGVFRTLNSLTSTVTLDVQTDILGTGLKVQNLNPSNSSFAAFIQHGGAGTALNARTIGGGRAALFELTQTGNTSNAVEITTAGGGRALSVVQQLSSNSAPAVEIFAPGPGAALFAQTGNGGNPSTVARFLGFGNGTNSVMFAIAGGSAAAVHGFSNNLGTGPAGLFETFNTASAAPAVSMTTGGTGPVFIANHTGSTGALAVYRVNGVNQVRFSRTGRGFFNGGTQTGGADVAEAFEVEGAVTAYQPGDVLEISTTSDRRVTLSSGAYSTGVIGVYATKPGVLLTELDIDEPLDRMIPVGVIGVIPTRVTAENGAIHRGDLLVSSGTPGHAMRADRRRLQFGMVVGKALEEFAGPGSGLIRVLVNVK
jgi:hypothetical protein